MAASTLLGQFSVKIFGGVEKPGTYTLEEGSGIFDLVAKANGFLEGSGGDHPIVQRTIDEKHATEIQMKLDMLKLIEKEENVFLQEGDVVYVPNCVGVGLGGIWGDELKFINQSVFRLSTKFDTSAKSQNK